MAMDSYLSYLDNLAQSPNDFYRDNTQEFISRKFDNTTRLDTIYEESIPFNFDFVNSYEVIVDSVSDTYTNVTKITGDYKSILYKDCEHKVIRGQYILYDNDYYLVYEATSKLATTSKPKIIRCNNYIKWYDENNIVRKYPVMIGTDYGSTNPQVSKDGIVPNGRLVLMIQGNEHTRNIFLNQRFVLSHKQVFKVNEIDMYNIIDTETEEVPMMKIYIEFVPANQHDDLKNNISHNDIEEEQQEEIPTGDKIVIDPPIDIIYEYEKKIFVANLYADTVLTTENVTCVGSGANNDSYLLKETINKNEFELECLKASEENLVLTFTSGIVEREVIVQLKKFM